MPAQTLTSSAQLNRYAEQFLKAIPGHDVIIEKRATLKDYSVSLNNPPAFTVHGRLCYALPANFPTLSHLVLEGVYGRCMNENSGDDAERMRATAGLVVPLHRCAQSLGLQAAIDYDGRIIKSPGITIGGKFEEDRFPDFLRLINMAHSLIDFYIVPRKP